MGKVFHGGTLRPSGGTLTRFVGTSHHANRKQAELRDSHRAMREATTLFPKSIVSASDSPRLFVSGVNSAKIGREVRVGRWRGMPIYHLTLVERETCPTSCHVYSACFGNAMPFTRRHKADEALEPAIEDEVAELAERHPGGFVVRLHGLGDFYSEDYVRLWWVLLGVHPGLRIFGYTAHDAASPIGRWVDRLNTDYPDHCFIRFSVSADTPIAPMQATTIWRQADSGRVPEGVVCPAQRGVTQCCGTCGLCWWEPARHLRIVFQGHGKRHRPKAPRSPNAVQHDNGHNIGE